MICIGHNQHAVLAPPITKSIFSIPYIRVFIKWQPTWVFITLTDDDVENILNLQKLSSNTKNVIEMSFIVLCEYARTKSKPIN